MQHRHASLLFALVLAVPTLAHAGGPTDAELTKCIGTKGDTLARFSNLKKNMPLAEVADLYPGADKVSKFNISKIPATDCAGATSFSFHFLENKKTKAIELHGVTIVFDKKHTSDEDFYKRLSSLLFTKYGPIKDEKALEKRLLTWGTKTGVAQFAALTKAHPFTLKAPVAK